MTIFDHLWQSTLVAILICLLTLLFRKQSAAIRYRLWLAASLKFLLPFSLVAALGRELFVHPVPAGSLAVLTRMRPVVLPFSAATQAPDHLPWLGVLTALWALGAGGVAYVWLARWVRLRRIARASTPLPFDLPVPVRATPLLLEPGLVGIRRPVILLPEGIFGQLSATEIDAILNHELCHWRRRDNLLAALHMLVQAVFWFHPLVWFIGARLIEEREKACDEGVLAGGQNPLEYAQAILRVCRLYLRSPLSCASGVAGADLGRRVDAIMAGADLEDLDPARKFLLASLLTATLLGPLATGMLRSMPPDQMVQRLATALLPAPDAARPAMLRRPVASNPARRRQRAQPVPSQDQAMIVQPRMLQAPALPAGPSLIVIPAPQLDSDQAQAAAETKVCRPPQRLPDSRLVGPEVCMSQSQWDQLSKRDLVLMPDGRTLVAHYEKAHSLAAGTCSPRGNGAMAASQVVSAGYCF